MMSRYVTRQGWLLARGCVFVGDVTNSVAVDIGEEGFSVLSTSGEGEELVQEGNIASV